MKKIITIALLLPLSLLAQNTQQRTVIQTSQFARQINTNETASGFVNALGLSTNTSLIATNLVPGSLVNPVNLIQATNISTTNLVGTIQPGNFPAAIPESNGANLTNLNGTAISSGTVAEPRIDPLVARDSELNTASNVVRSLAIQATNDLAAGLATGAAPVAAEGVTGNLTVDSVTTPTLTVTGEITGQLSTAETARLRGQREFNVEDYGALPNTESTAAIAAAVSAAAAVGGVVDFPRTLYRVTNAIPITAKILIQGRAAAQNNEATITNTAGTDTFVVTNQIASLEMHNVKLISAGGGTNAHVRLLGQSVSAAIGEVYFNNCYFEGGRYGIFATNVYSSRFHGGSFRTNATAMYFGGAAVGRIEVKVGGFGSGVGIGIDVDTSANVILDGCDIGANTNMVVVRKPVFVKIMNCNFEGGLASSQNTFDRAYVKAHPASSGGMILIEGSSFRASNGSPLTDVYSLSVSNISAIAGDGNLFIQAGASGQIIQEWGTTPCPAIFSSPSVISGLSVTNMTRASARRAGWFPQDLEASGRVGALTPSYHGMMWLDSRTNATGHNEAFYFKAKMTDGNIHDVNFLEYYTDIAVKNRLGFGASRFAGWSGASSASVLDISGNLMVVGANNNSTIRSDDSFKTWDLRGVHFDTDQTPWQIVNEYSGNAGGGYGSQNHVVWGNGGGSRYAMSMMSWHFGSTYTSTSPPESLMANISGWYFRTNVYAPFVYATNLVVMGTNYNPALWSVPAGEIRFLPSNYMQYAVTIVSTNPIWVP